MLKYVVIVVINFIVKMLIDFVWGCFVGYNGFFCIECIKYNVYFIYKCMFNIGCVFNINWKDVLLFVVIIFVVDLNILFK